MNDLFEIKEHICTFGERKDVKWTKEANIVSWNGGEPKLDIREWSPGHNRMSRGIGLSEDEARMLVEALSERYPSVASEGKKKLYTVHFHAHIGCDVEVCAESEEEAIRLAEIEFGNIPLEDFEFIDSVNEGVVSVTEV